MRSIGPAALLVGLFLAVAACGAKLPSPGDIANHVQLGREGSTLVATVTPWPLDKAVAFFCPRDPGSAFSIENPSPPASSGCVAADTSTGGDQLVAKFDPTKLDPAPAAVFAAQKTWFLAVSGSRGPISVANVLTVPNIPAPS